MCGKDMATGVSACRVFKAVWGIGVVTTTTDASWPNSVIAASKCLRVGLLHSSL